MDDSHAFRAVWGTDFLLWVHDAGERVAGWWRTYGTGIGQGWRTRQQRLVEVKIKKEVQVKVA